MNLKNQRRMAAELLKCGEHRVWIDPDGIEEVDEAVTRDDIRNLIKDGVIRKVKKKGVSRSRTRAKAAKKKKGRGKGYGSRKGTKYARYPRKKRWMDRIRALRKTLKELRDRGELKKREYRKLYVQASSGVFKSKKHMLSQIKGKE